ncbi:hypothetical protein AWB70_07559 [Caballeronia cordobensis]|uniref:Uncharacterized protein n=1 Tax=Caballeronia cordobensis TaxID=1353886 RepID=A0A158JW71_CABCO|nr:hypothetical protein AWB70_07559 [Caballeronia cordobensis]
MFFGQHEFECMQRCIGLIERLFQQAREAFPKANDGALIEEIGGVAQRACHTFRCRCQVKGEIELGAGF